MWDQEIGLTQSRLPGGWKKTTRRSYFFYDPSSLLIWQNINQVAWTLYKSKTTSMTHVIMMHAYIHDMAKNCTHKKWLNLIFYTSIYINTCYMRVKSRCMCLVRVKLTAYKSSSSLLYYIKIAFFGTNYQNSIRTISLQKLHTTLFISTFTTNLFVLLIWVIHYYYGINIWDVFNWYIDSFGLVSVSSSFSLFDFNKIIQYILQKQEFEVF